MKRSRASFKLEISLVFFNSTSLKILDYVTGSQVIKHIMFGASIGQQCFRFWMIVPIYQIHKYHKAPLSYTTMYHSEQKCANFCSEWCTCEEGQLRAYSNALLQNARIYDSNIAAYINKGCMCSADQVASKVINIFIKSGGMKNVSRTSVQYLHVYCYHRYYSWYLVTYIKLHAPLTWQMQRTEYSLSM